MKDITKTYRVEHEFGITDIQTPEGGFPINLNITMSFQTFTYLTMLICLIGFIVSDLIEKIVK